MNRIKVNVRYDEEAKVFIGKNDEIPFITEAPLLDALVARIVNLLSDDSFLFWNGKLTLKIEIPISLIYPTSESDDYWKTSKI